MLYQTASVFFFNQFNQCKYIYVVGIYIYEKFIARSNLTADIQGLASKRIFTNFKHYKYYKIYTDNRCRFIIYKEIFHSLYSFFNI